VLRELADLDNPMRTSLGDQPGTGGLLETIGAGPDGGSSTAVSDRQSMPADAAQTVDDLVGPPREPIGPTSDAPAAPDRRRSTALPSVEPDPHPADARSRFDVENGVVLYNDRHPDYLLVKDDEGSLLDYLAILVAKEYVLYNNSRSAPDEFAEELVRMLVRVRRHMPRRR
jgi:hypothetical protein